MFNIWYIILGCIIILLIVANIKLRFQIVRISELSDNYYEIITALYNKFLLHLTQMREFDDKGTFESDDIIGELYSYYKNSMEEISEIFKIEESNE